MASLTAEERIQAASQFLLQSPPGEINDVLNGTVDSFWYPDHAQLLTHMRSLR